MSGEATTIFAPDGVSQTCGGDERRIAFDECREAEEAGGLIYIWGRDGPPLVLPRRALSEGEAAGLVARVNARIRSGPPA